jgi:hypothetical protein
LFVPTNEQEIETMLGKDFSESPTNALGEACDDDEAVSVPLS